MLEIKPIDQELQQQVIAEVQRYVKAAAERYQQGFSEISVVFNLRGKTAGMYKANRPSIFSSWQRQIRFNPWLFAKFFDDSWQNTIPHEVAHYIADCRFGLLDIKPHGREWQQIMRDFGAEPRVSANYDLTGIPVRRTQRFDYKCACRQVSLSSQRHHKIQQGIQSYLCRDCGQTLVLMN